MSIEKKSQEPASSISGVPLELFKWIVFAFNFKLIEPELSSAFRVKSDDYKSKVSLDNSGSDP